MHLAPYDLVLALVRRTWLVALVAVVVCAALAARVVTNLVADREPLPTTAPTAAKPPPRAQARRHRVADTGGFVERDMFCSSCVPRGDPKPSPCETALLVATIVGPDPRATLRVLATDAQGSWGLGDDVPGVGRIDRIGRGSIDVISLDGYHSVLALDPRADLRCTGVPPPTVPAAPWADRVKELGEREFEVDRSLIRELASGGSLGRARVIPAIDHGEIAGVRVFGITPSSVLSAIGLKNGDLLSAIDGAQINSAQQLLDFYARLDQLSSVEVSGMRAGKPLQITLHLR